MLKGYKSGSDVAQEIGRVPKKGFETVLTTPGAWSRISAIALNAQDEELGESEMVATVLIGSQISSAGSGDAGDTVTLKRSTVWILASGFVLFSVVFCFPLFSSWLRTRRYMRLS